ncbi:macrocin-O-methyltransferase [Candidatus Uhrbacteria bacterium RIFCSPLOWO2_01_FULL_47_24]|uniref:Macrocin-O-methyltransferase n=1 Tax=Candidatus Uhrbacteria bacterium RIFCSPLOWO2_01_FULL_47_24 TaxID=1802401 RepID=A0A1F7USY3_9BACT|nr:MAG: macrocin-O-methyltransferase [Candidatus Uhrbacteria bacterium RIFCSPHIGHO2_01_FULL_47_11]OGL67795.1 MAG: macrocin-O-methyltransferase [Candidatus Uhrbacteria bacterium RIFCSPHIGHO2_02_FULL_46_47]OGL76329.1 MAG: macrocin-O-methyltransferase [Candidatus Uhrbacteria bacterium RIFCSPHIGHO2_12_FULL_47_11]OGL81365.1 MAG: macrocin-O-methyltransferase [Candidatus Uhrbacteria bacterium RIFCSPLOWO2_01_FULL_47_24]OGL83799.1 MAG: macrocin-O-methyltransferase [Candidatus Uhrbacteria bacterium RIFCS
MIKKIAKKIIKWLATAKWLAFPRKIIVGLACYAFALKNGVIIYYNDPQRSEVLRLVRKIKKENEMLLGDNEAYQIFMAVKRTEKIDGDIAEVGSYRGGSAKLICEAKGNKTLYLFDTFEGLPELHAMDNPNQFHKGQFSAQLEQVKHYLGEYENVYFYKGLFPSTAEPIKNKTFSFVHLDLDLHEPTAASLQFFYPRMNRGGIIISHDYINAPGVRKAFDDFFKDKPEPIIEMSGLQCLIVKI